MSTNIERAAEVIGRFATRSPIQRAQDLAAEGLLVTDEQQRLIRLGEAVERIKARELEEIRRYGYTISTPLSLFNAIYAEAEKP